MSSKSLRSIGGVIILIVSLVAVWQYAHRRQQLEPITKPLAGSLRLSSSAFAAGTTIPAKYTCQGDNISPPLDISGVPDNTETLVLIVHDPDAPRGDWVHWLVWNLPPSTKTIAENSMPTGTVQGTTSFDKVGYGGPCPPSGTHHYVFDLYALNNEPNLSPSTTREQLQAAMNGHIVDQAKLVGLFSK